MNEAINCLSQKPEKQLFDERSYKIYLTATGVSELKKGYEIILQPFYDLWRSSGDDFEAFMHYADKLATQIEKGQGNTHDNEVL